MLSRADGDRGGLATRHWEHQADASKVLREGRGISRTQVRSADRYLSLVSLANSVIYTLCLEIVNPGEAKAGEAAHIAWGNPEANNQQNPYIGGKPIGGGSRTEGSQGKSKKTQPTNTKPGNGKQKNTQKKTTGNKRKTKNAIILRALGRH